MTSSTPAADARDERRVRVLRSPGREVALPETYPSWQADLQYVDEILRAQSGPEAERYVQVAERRLARRRARHQGERAEADCPGPRSGIQAEWTVSALRTGCEGPKPSTPRTSGSAGAISSSGP